MKMNLEKQRKNVTKLLELIQENPDLPILPMVATECVLDDSFGYWMAQWSSAKKDKYYVADERVYQHSEDFASLVETWIDNNNEAHEGLSDVELESLGERIVSQYEWVDAIIVHIEQQAPEGASERMRT